MRIVEFDYKPEFASTMGIDHIHQTGSDRGSSASVTGDRCDCSDSDMVVQAL